MTQKKSLNKKRLTKKQVQELVKTEGKLHEEFTKLLEETYLTGYKRQPLVYELPNERFLFVFDSKESYIGGKADIYPKQYFLRFIQWTQKVRENADNNCGSSIEHWRYYSRHQIDLVNQIEKLIDALIERLNIPYSQLDFSYVSLDILSSKTEDYGIDKAQAELYDNLIAYVGEVLRHRVNGQWAIHGHSINERYPYIKTDINGFLMPINVVWQELSGLEPMNLRKETANEIRHFSLRKS